MNGSKNNVDNGIRENNSKLQLKFEKQIQINKLILLSDGRLCSTSNNSITIYNKDNYQIQTKIKLNSMIENIVELSGCLIVKQKHVYELYIYRKKDFKLIQLINHRFVVETIFEVNEKLIIWTKYNSDIGIEIWEKDKNNLYKITGFLISNLLSSFCFINEDKNKSNVFFCKDPLSKGLKDDYQVMQEKNKLDLEYSKIKGQVTKMIQEREELKNRIKFLNEQIYQLGGGQVEIIKKSQSQFNPMMPYVCNILFYKVKVFSNSIIMINFFKWGNKFSHLSSSWYENTLSFSNESNVNGF